MLTLLPVFSIDTVPLGVKLNSAYATEPQAGSLIALRAEMQRCAELRYAAWQATDPVSVVIFQEGGIAVDGVFTDLVRRQVTWGQAATRLQAIDVSTIAQVRKHEAMMLADDNANHSAELQRRAAIANSIQSNMAQQQLINNMNRPRTTNCNTFGNTVNCTSY